jgi:Bacterial Ig domain
MGWCYIARMNLPRRPANDMAARAILSVLLCWSAACGSTTPAPTAPVTPPAPVPPTVENAAPVVSVAFTSASSCMPHGSFSCTLDVVAQASDSDGDSLTYSWSGCATGNTSKAVCTIKDPGKVTATVTVDDGHGHQAAASASGEGDPEPSNNPPSVAVSFPAGAQCTPSPSTPCALDVVAQAVDPDGDPLHYSWSGCATGAGERARCTVVSPGLVTATVTVDDLHAHVVRASATGTGVNRLPDVSVGYVVITATGGEIDVLGGIVDPEDGFLCGAEYCGGLTVAGACGTGFLACSCLADLEARIIRTATAGTCTITFEVKDKWGAVGRPTIAIDVATLKVLSHTSPQALAIQVPQGDKR